MFWSEIGSRIGEPGSTHLPRILRSTSRALHKEDLTNYAPLQEEAVSALRKFPGISMTENSPKIRQLQGFFYLRS